jgi:cytochrome bd ubiquinol oxidase subunit II
VVTVIAVVLVVPALVVLYRLDTSGKLEPLTDADVAGTPPRPGTAPP